MLKYKDYTHAMLLKSRLYDMIKEFGEELCIDYNSWFIIDRPPTRVGRYRSVICYILLVDGKHTARTKDIVIQLTRFFGFKEKTILWNIVWHIRKDPLLYSNEIRIVRYYLVQHNIIDDTLSYEKFLECTVKKKKEV